MHLKHTKTTNFIRRDDYKIYCVHLFFMCIAWSLSLLCYFPGVGMNDGLNVLAGRLASANQFPIFYCIYVVILGKIGNLFGSLQYAIALYSVFQILICAVLCSAICTWIWNHIHNKLFCILSSIYFVCSPTIAMYSISMIKDTVFGCALIYFCMLLVRLYKKDHSNRYDSLILITLSILISTIRSNGIYVILATLVCLWIFNKQKWHLYALTAAVIIFVTMMGNVIMSHYDVKHNFSEVVGIPIQQISAVAAYDGLISEEQKITFEHFIQIEDAASLYNPSSSDPVKWSTAFNRKYLNSHKAEFLHLWADLLPSNFDIYFQAYLDATYWFWIPVQKGSIQSFNSIVTIADNTYLLQFLEENGIHDAPIIHGLLFETLRKWLSYAPYYFREGVCFWIMIIAMLKCILTQKAKRRETISFFIPQFLVWMTLMVSTPISSSFRYVTFYLYAMPIYIALIVLPSKRIQL